MGIREIMSALNVLKAVPQADLDKIVAEAGGEVVKGDMHAEGLKPGEMVHDFRTEDHVATGPTKQEIRTGPSEEASGAGTERMISHYSPNQATQMGIVLMAEKFEKLIAPMATSMKAIVDGQKSLVDLMTPLAVKAKDDDEDEEEEEEVVEVNASRAKSLIAKAEKMLKSAKAMAEEAEDEDDEEKARKARRESRKLMKAAGKLLLRARSRAYAAQAKGKELRVAIRTLIVKADISVSQEEEEEDEEKAKAGMDAARNQADHPNADGNQDDSAEKARGAAAEAAKATEAAKIAEAAKAGEFDEARLKKALEDAGIPMLSMKVNEVMDVLSGRSRVQAAPSFDLAKAKLNYVEGRLAAITAAKAAGRLTETDESIVRDLLNMHKNAEAGNIDMSIVKSRLQVAPRAVQDFIAVEAA